VETHKSQLKEFEQQLGRLEKNLDAGRSDLGAEEELFKHRGKSNRNIDSNNVQAVIEMGDQGQKDIEEALGRIDKNVVQMDEQADTLILELDRQIQKLDKIYEDLNDTETTLKRYKWRDAGRKNT
jgi:peptidoglycan hydrolase CwlO-like protein